MVSHLFDVQGVFKVALTRAPTPSGVTHFLAIPETFTPLSSHKSTDTLRCYSRGAPCLASRGPQLTRAPTPSGVTHLIPPRTRGEWTGSQEHRHPQVLLTHLRPQGFSGGASHKSTDTLRCYSPRGPRTGGRALRLTRAPTPSGVTHAPKATPSTWSSWLTRAPTPSGVTHERVAVRVRDHGASQEHRHPQVLLTPSASIAAPGGNQLTRAPTPSGVTHAAEAESRRIHRPSQEHRHPQVLLTRSSGTGRRSRQRLPRAPTPSGVTHAWSTSAARVGKSSQEHRHPQVLLTPSRSRCASATVISQEHRHPQVLLTVSTPWDPETPVTSQEPRHHQVLLTSQWRPRTKTEMSSQEP